MIAVAPFILTMKALEEWVDAPRCRRMCEAAGYAFHALADGKHYACFCLGPEGPHTLSDRPDSWAVTRGHCSRQRVARASSCI